MRASPRGHFDAIDSETQAAEIIGGTPQQFGAFIKSELKRWPEVVTAAGIKPE